MENNLGNKESMAKNIKYFMAKKDITRMELCKALGFNYSTLADWLHARKYPRIDKIEMMANYFGVSKADLVEERSQIKDESRLLRDEREVEHMRKYRALSEEQRAAIDNQLDFYFARIEVEITVPDERAELHRQLDEALAREKKGARVSSSGRSATGMK